MCHSRGRGTAGLRRDAHSQPTTWGVMLREKKLLLTPNILLWLDSSSIGLGDGIDLLLIMQNIQWMAKMLLKGAHGTL